MASEDPKLQEAIAFLQKTNLNGESVYEQLAKVVGACPTNEGQLSPIFSTLIRHPPRGFPAHPAYLS